MYPFFLSSSSPFQIISSSVLGLFSTCIIRVATSFVLMRSFIEAYKCLLPLYATYFACPFLQKKISFFPCCALSGSAFCVAWCGDCRCCKFILLLQIYPLYIIHNFCCFCCCIGWPLPFHKYNSIYRNWFVDEAKRAEQKLLFDYTGFSVSLISAVAFPMIWL